MKAWDLCCPLLSLTALSHFTPFYYNNEPDEEDDDADSLD